VGVVVLKNTAGGSCEDRGSIHLYVFLVFVLSLCVAVPACLLLAASSLHSSSSSGLQFDFGGIKLWGCVEDEEADSNSSSSSSDSNSSTVQCSGNGDDSMTAVQRGVVQWTAVVSTDKQTGRQSQSR
jgi:hypothetical protein